MARNLNITPNGDGWNLSLDKPGAVRLTIQTSKPVIGGMIVDAEGHVIGSIDMVESPVPRPPLRIPDDFDPEQEAARAKQGGCCGQPSADE